MEFKTQEEAEKMLKNKSKEEIIAMFRETAIKLNKIEVKIEEMKKILYMEEK